MNLFRSELCVLKAEMQNCRVIKVAKKFADADRRVSFAVSDVDDFRHELDEYGLTDTGDKPVVAAHNVKEEKFVMQTDFRSVLLTALVVLI